MATSNIGVSSDVGLTAEDLQQLDELQAKRLQTIQAKNAGRPEFVKGLLSGIDQSQALYYGAKGLAQSAMGDKIASRRSFKEYQRQNLEAQENQPRVQTFFSTDKDTGALGGIGNFTDWASATVGQLLPSMVEAAASGIVSGAIGSQVTPGIDPTDVVTAPAGVAAGVFSRLFARKATNNLLQEIAETQLSKGLSKEAAQTFAQNVVKIGGKELVDAELKRMATKWGANTGVILSTGAMESAQMWGDGMERGIDNPTSAAMLGLLSGASEVFLGNAPMAMKAFLGRGVSSTVNKVARVQGPRKAAGYLWDVIHNMGEEGAQESFQQMLQSVNSEINDPKFRITDKSTFMDWAESGAAGTLGGLVFGAPATVHNAITQEQNNRSAKKILATDKGIDAWTKINPDGAKKLSSITGIPTDKDLFSVGLPRMSESERKAFADRVRARVPSASPKVSPIDMETGKLVALVIPPEQDKPAVFNFDWNDFPADPNEYTPDDVTRLRKVYDEAVETKQPSSLIDEINNVGIQARAALDAKEEDDAASKRFAEYAAMQPQETATIEPEASTISQPSVKNESVLPEGLSRSNPTYNFGTKHFDLQFASDIDKALFVTSQEKKSKGDAKFREFLKSQGLTDEDIDREGVNVKNAIKTQAKANLTSGKSVLNIGNIYVQPEKPSAQIPTPVVKKPLTTQSPENVKPAQVSPVPTVKESLTVDKPEQAIIPSQAKPVIKEALTTEPTVKDSLTVQEPEGMPSEDDILANYKKLAPKMRDEIARKNTGTLRKAIIEGKWTDLLHPKNRGSRSVFTAMTGVNLPVTLADTMDAYRKWISEGRKFTKTESVPELAKEVKPVTPSGRGFLLAETFNVDGVTDAIDSIFKIVDGYVGKRGKVRILPINFDQFSKLAESNGISNPQNRTAVTVGTVGGVDIYFNKDYTHNAQTLLASATHEGFHAIGIFDGAFIGTEWRSLSSEQRRLAATSYGSGLSELSDAELRMSYAASQEWFAFQGHRLLTSEVSKSEIEKEYGKSFADRLSEIVQKFRDILTLWIGSSETSTANIDKRIREIIGQYEKRSVTTEQPDKTKESVSETATIENADLIAEGKNLLNGLFSPSDDYEQSIPSDRFMGMMGLAQKMVERGFNTPYQVAKFLDDVAKSAGKPNATRKFSAAFWNALKAVNTKLEKTPKWDDIYNKIDGKEPKNESEQRTIEQGTIAGDQQPSKRGVSKSPVKGREADAGLLGDVPARNVREVEEPANAGEVRGISGREGNGANGERDGNGNAPERRTGAIGEGLVSNGAGERGSAGESRTQLSVVKPIDESEPKASTESGWTDEVQKQYRSFMSKLTRAKNAGNGKKIVDIVNEADEYFASHNAYPDNWTSHFERMREDAAGMPSLIVPLPLKPLVETKDIEKEKAEATEKKAGRQEAKAKKKTAQNSQAKLPNYHMTNPEAIVGGTPKQKFSRNQEALETFERVSDENRAPTEEERNSIAAYIGWGSFGQELFNGSWELPRPKAGWEKEDRWLRDHLGEEAWKSAQSSIINAHYTDPATVSSMWDMVQRMGFNGGRVLEPSMGIGNFFALMPPNLEKLSTLTGIELDKTTGAMAQMLYPSANIQIKGYQESQTPDNFYDLVIGNWPFAAQSPADRRYDKFNATLHDYFFLKALDQVRAGGLVIGITSTGTLDKKSQIVRLELAKKADLVAAFRLPTGAFGQYAGTSVVTDIVILKKRSDGVALTSIPSWVETIDMITPAGPEIRVNKYYQENPQNVLGTLNYGHHTTTGRPGMIVDRPEDFERRLPLLAKMLKTGVYEDRKGADSASSYIANNTKDRNGSIVVQEDGDLYIVEGEHLLPLEQRVKYAVKSKEETASRKDAIVQLTKIRKVLGQLVDAQRDGAKNENELRVELNKLYDAFVAKFGNINSTKSCIKYLKKAGDPAVASVMALEKNTEKDTALPPKWGKSAILLRSTARAKPRAENLSIRDAYIFQRNEALDVNLDRIAALSNKTVDEVLADLTVANVIYKDPTGSWLHADVYLSGNVRIKLREALAAKEQGVDGMDRNIEALNKVVPESIPYYKIEAKLGNNWTTAEYYKDFLEYLLNLKPEERNAAEVNFGAQGWRIHFKNRNLNFKPEATAKWGVVDYSFEKLFQSAMNNSVIVIRKKDSDGNWYVDEESSEKANEKAATIRDEFSTWIWKDAERRIDSERSYNEVFNSSALPSYDGDFLRFEGMALERGDHPFNLRKHQSSAIARGVILGRGIYAHEVGTGKTYTMGGIAIESRRYGKAKKPLIFAHNANSASVAQEIQEMYPGAHVLYIESLGKDDRALKLAQIINEDWDAIVVPHSLVDRFALREETYRALAAEDIAEMEAAAIEAAQDDGATLDISMMQDEKQMKKVRSVRAKQLVKNRNAIIEQIKKMSASTAEDAIHLEDAGIDMVIVDEAHVFKKPPISTKMHMRGLNTSSSDQSVNMMFLLRYLNQMHGGAGVHLFTGTPITNTLNEIYNMMRFVMGDIMKRDGVAHWDAWFNTFADQKTEVEVTPSGEYEPVTRLSSFVNVPELRQMAGQYMDTVFADQMPEFKDRQTPDGKSMKSDALTPSDREILVNGRTENPQGRPYKLVRTIVAPMTQIQKEVRGILAVRSKKFRDASKKERKEMLDKGAPETPIRVETDAANAGLDARLYDIGAEDDANSKIGIAVKNIVSIYNEAPNTTQAIFMERGFSDFSERTIGKDANGKPIKEKVPRFNLAKDIVKKLVDAGIPESQIAVVDGSVKKEERKRIADAMNMGTIRIVIGSTNTLGTGVNMQENLRAMHHLDAPWRPGDLEQRNGRGHRQGNKWNTVFEYRYVTEGIDGRRWQVLVVKQRFINDFMRSNGDTRVVDGDAATIDEGDLASTLAEATGDPRILQIAQAKKDIDKLQRRERLFVEGIADTKIKVKQLRSTNERLEREIERVEKFSAAIVEKQGKGFELKIGDKTYTDRKEDREAIDTAFDSLMATLPYRNQRAPKKIGEYYGFPLYGEVDQTFSRNLVPAYTLNAGTGSIEFIGTLASLEAKVRNYGKQVDGYKAQIADNERSIENLSKASGEKFGQQEQLDRKMALLDQLEQDIMRNPVPAPNWLRQSTPPDSLVYVDGQPLTVVGHKWGADGWFVVVNRAEGTEDVLYTKVKDDQGAQIYEERAFVPPEIIKKEEPEKPGDAGVPALASPELPSPDKNTSEQNAAWDKNMQDSLGWIKSFLEKQPKDSNLRPELSLFDTTFKTIFHYSEKVPALRRLFRAAQRLRDNKHSYGEDIFGIEEKDLAAIRQFEKKNKNEWARLESHLWKRDRDAIGYRVVQSKNGYFEIRDPQGVYVRTFSSEEDAWNQAFGEEAHDIIRSGFSEGAAATLVRIRQINARMYRQLSEQARELEARLIGLNMEMPKVESDDGKIDLFSALSQMGDRRGYYMPRIRKSGQYMLWAHKEGENPILEIFATEIGRRVRATSLKRSGYDVNYSLSNRPSEDAFIDADMIAMNDIINNAIERTEKANKATTLSDFGVESGFEDYNRKSDGKTEKHFVVDVGDNRTYIQVLRDYGAVLFPDGKWHIMKPSKNIGAQLLRVFNVHDQANIIPMRAFSEQFARQIANLIHSRGSRARKISRSEATGEDVTLGYEEDAIKAVTMAGKSTAGGTAKRIMAREMMTIITGTDIPWKQFYSDFVKSHPELTDEKELKKAAWEAYSDSVKERRIESATQPIAYKEAMSFTREMLRNEEPIERVIGTARGIASVWYLSGIASGVINMTALATTVPAAMKTYGGISMLRAPHLLMKGVNNYVKSLLWRKFGKGSAMQGDDEWLFSEIARRGWDESLQNTEAVSVLQNNLQRGWNRIIDVFMSVFSITERINRGSTIAATYYGLREKGLSREDALERAKDVSDKGHGVYGKENLPSWARGSNLGAQVSRSFMTFKTFSHNYMQIIGEMLSKKEWNAAGWAIFSPTIFGGAAASLATIPLNLLAKAIASAIPGWDTDDPEEDFYRWLESEFGETSSNVARAGLPTLAGINLKGSLAIQLGIPTSISEVIGAPYSLMEDFFYGARNLVHGDIIKGVEQITPRLISSPIRGFREATEGFTTRSNMPVYYGNERLRSDWIDSLYRLLSFNPSDTSLKRERQWKETVSEKKESEQRSVIYAKMRRFMLNRGSKSDWLDILNDVNDYNARIRRSKYKSIPFITEKIIRAQIKKMDTISKREKIRAGLVEREEVGEIDYSPFEKIPNKRMEESRQSSNRNIRRSIIRRA